MQAGIASPGRPVSRNQLLVCRSMSSSAVRGQIIKPHDLTSVDTDPDEANNLTRSGPLATDTGDRKPTPALAVNSRRSPTTSRLSPEDLSPVGVPWETLKKPWGKLSYHPD
ncbi:hypothetical protein PoB_000197400 [Plakobranchus ocellatus]|uniref:Uncharacterized protein n=1 Tax=Plakobranchus ocellatus TaxID=259542 RepID=A0AAV3XZV0_9GAST|nr:hypothetical protein PoB_000197400 [Plakobranchus ocellatus]